MSWFYENIQIINMLNENSHESDEPEINSAWNSCHEFQKNSYEIEVD